MLRTALLALAFAGSLVAPASAQAGPPDVQPVDESSVDARRVATTDTQVTLATPVHEWRVGRFERMRRRARRMGFVTAGVLGASALLLTLEFTVDWRKPPDPPPYISPGENFAFGVGGGLGLLVVPLSVVTGGLLGRSGCQLRMLARVVPTANVVAGDGFVVGAAGRF